MQSWTIVSVSETQTLDIGMTLGRLLEQPALILLQGNLGAGKSVLARGVARGVGVDPAIPITSPTFTLMNHYQARLPLYHFDLYRLSDPDELIELGFDYYAHGIGVALVEWPEKLEDDEVGGLWVELVRLDSERRQLNFRATNDASRNLLERLAKHILPGE
ncbi:MAG: tRNA (adenosine(37)-N6)-threonylcarbamoyltransferase complex ATPase subunit type 1 TsaE [Desulfuromonas sp.]|nr:MAG: tRNA (adenosine(37)-N6)-threonylcarbamoyltransferase complex ATPase subunit type 1 TsaE [Desulfuromonas sp.]